MLCRTFFDCQKKILVRTAGKRYEVRPYFTFTVGSFYISMLAQVIPVDRLQRTGIQHPVLERCLLLVLMSNCNEITLKRTHTRLISDTDNGPPERKPT